MVMNAAGNHERNVRKAVNTPLDDQAKFFKTEIRLFFEETNGQSGHKKASSDHSISVQFSVRDVGETTPVTLHTFSFADDLEKAVHVHAVFAAPLQTVGKPTAPAGEAVASGAP